MQYFDGIAEPVAADDTDIDFDHVHRYAEHCAGAFNQRNACILGVEIVKALGLRAIKIPFGQEWLGFRHCLPVRSVHLATVHAKLLSSWTRELRYNGTSSLFGVCANPTFLYGAVFSLKDWLIMKISANCLCLFLLLFGLQEVSWGQFRRIQTIAGNGSSGPVFDQGRALQVPLSNPFGIDQAADGSLIVASYDQHAIYRLLPDYTQMELVAGIGVPGMSGDQGEHATQVNFNQPHEVQVAENGDIYVADTMNHRVGKVEAATGRWFTIAGTGEKGFAGDNGDARKALLNQAYSIALDGNELFIADLGNNRIRKLDLQTNHITTICGTGESELPNEGGLASRQPLAGPRSLAVDARNIWIVLREGSSVWRINRDDHCVYHVAGTGEKGYSGDGAAAKLAKLNGPKGIAVDPDVAVYIVDTENHAIRRVKLSNGVISTVVGSPDGTPGFSGDGDELTKRLLRRPHGVCLLKNGELVIGDSENHRLRELTQ